MPPKKKPSGPKSSGPGVITTFFTKKAQETIPNASDEASTSTSSSSSSVDPNPGPAPTSSRVEEAASSSSLACAGAETTAVNNNATLVSNCC